LDALVGEWTVEIAFPADPAKIVHEQTSCVWLEGGAFLLMRSAADDPSVPNSSAVIGRDETAETYAMLYFDARGVSRIYAMSLEGGVWRLWRDAPGFSQRFTGTFTDDGRTITAAWEISADGTHWELDLNLTYTKVR
jgi:hypothetical protein